MLLGSQEWNTMWSSSSVAHPPQDLTFLKSDYMSCIFLWQFKPLWPFSLTSINKVFSPTDLSFTQGFLFFTPSCAKTRDCYVWNSQVSSSWNTQTFFFKWGILCRSQCIKVTAEISYNSVKLLGNVCSYSHIVACASYIQILKKMAEY